MSVANWRGGLGFSLLALFGMSLWFGAQALNTNAHLPDVECGGCHLARGEITAANAHKLVSNQEDLCGTCHEAAIKVSHPSGIRVRRDLPAEFPLDWKNDLTCSTCHQIHGENPGLMRVAEQGPAMCRQCHDDQFFARMRDGGESLMVSGHIDGRIKSADYESELDRYSVQCLQCHQGEFTSDRFRISRTILRHGSNRMNHPIGSTYSYYESYGGYRKMSALKEDILLPNGRLACVSCHRGYSIEHGELVVARGRLCYECHDL